MLHTIAITLTPDGKDVTADSNPLGMKPGDRVTWTFSGNTVGPKIQILFRQFYPPGSPTAGTTNPSPLSVLSPATPVLKTRGVYKIEGTVREEALDGLYTYNIFNGNTKLGWLQPFPEPPNAEDPFFGGLEIPGKPPGGR